MCWFFYYYFFFSLAMLHCCCVRQTVRRRTTKSDPPSIVFDRRITIMIIINNNNNAWGDYVGWKNKIDSSSSSRVVTIIRFWDHRRTADEGFGVFHTRAAPRGRSVDERCIMPNWQYYRYYYIFFLDSRYNIAKYKYDSQNILL
jgi:hypothetical protein